MSKASGIQIEWRNPLCPKMYERRVDSIPACLPSLDLGESMSGSKVAKQNSNTKIIGFPTLKNSIIKNLKEYYSITDTPALIINDNVFQGRLCSATELMPS